MWLCCVFLFLNEGPYGYSGRDIADNGKNGISFQKYGCKEEVKEVAVLGGSLVSVLGFMD